MPGTWNQQRNDDRRAPRQAPEPTGELVAFFDRPGYRGAPAGQVRVTLDEYNGHAFLSLRLWEWGSEGEWWPTKKGISVRLGEAEGVAAALLRGLEIVEGNRQRPAVQGGRDAYQLQPGTSRPRSAPVRATVSPQRALPAPPPEAATEFHPGFDEFSGG